MNGRRKYLALFITALLVILYIVPAHAAGIENTDQEEKGTVQITLEYEKTAICDVGISLYKVADFDSESNNEKFVYIEPFQSFNDSQAYASDDDKELDATLEKLAAFIKDNNIEGTTKKTDEEGKVTFSELSKGLYLVVQTTGTNIHSESEPFFVSVPTRTANQWIYNIDAAPKVDMKDFADIHVNKVWKDGGRERPDNISVQLYKGRVLVDTVTLSRENQWSYTWENKEVSDDWSVKEINIQKGYTAVYSKDGNDFIVTNVYGLVQTGQLKWPIPVLACTGVLLFSLGWYICVKRKRDNRE